MDIYDSHTHLNQEKLFPRRKELLSSFIQIGGKGIVNAGANTFYNEKGILIAKESKNLFPGCWVKCCLGFHPCDVEQMRWSHEEEIKQLKKQILIHPEEVIAIGECGIDLHYDKEASTLTLQKKIFEKQCELARELHLPIVIHSREAFDQTFEILKNFSDLKIYFHCRGYGEKELLFLFNYFPKLFIGFCGNISYPKAEELRKSIKVTPKEKILIETDAPYLPPQAFRWEENTPERIVQNGQYIAKLLETTEEMLWQQVEQNFWELYRR